jgi:hypothetical protein
VASNYIKGAEDRLAAVEAVCKRGEGSDRYLTPDDRQHAVSSMQALANIAIRVMTGKKANSAQAAKMARLALGLPAAKAASE